MLRTVIVDDSEDILSLWSAALIQSGEFEVCGIAGDGVSAVEIVRRERPDLVLLDLSMPGLHGLDTLPLLHQASPGTRVAVVSSASRRDFAGRATSLGACGFVEKHLPLQSLAPRLLQLMSREPADANILADSATRPNPDVLVVEPDSADRELLEYLMGWLPYRAHVARDATEGLALAHRVAPKAVLIHFRRIRAEHPLRDLMMACESAGIPVISIGPADSGLDDRGLPTGVVQQLSEPVTSEDLDVVLRRWAGAHSTAPAPNDAVPAARAALATLIDEIGPAPARTAWTAFVRGTDTRYATARHAVGDRDATALAAAAHSVRGSAAAIGLPALARLGADLEAAARREDFDRATDLLSSLQHYREAVRVVAPVLPAPRTPGDAEPNSVDPRPTAGAPPRRRLLKWFGDQ